MTKSMTGYASVEGSDGVWSWVWDIRSVNGRGFDLRLRMPDWIGGLDQPVRAAIGATVRRGNVTVSLKMTRAERAGGDALDPRTLGRVLQQIAQIDTAAAAAGVLLSRPSSADILTARGVLATDAPDADPEALGRSLQADLPALVSALDDMRRTEGAALAAIISGQLDRVETLTGQAARLAEARKDQMAQRLKDNLARILDVTDGADPDRIAQELALIAVKTDVTEEIDRLGAHVVAAKALLQAEGAVGRKFDFLTQEFNREANTLCSKSQSTELTGVGLDLKAVIDQMREQVQNVE